MRSIDEIELNITLGPYWGEEIGFNNLIMSNVSCINTGKRETSMWMSMGQVEIGSTLFCSYKLDKTLVFRSQIYFGTLSL